VQVAKRSAALIGGECKAQSAVGVVPRRAFATLQSLPSNAAEPAQSG